MTSSKGQHRSLLTKHHHQHKHNNNSSNNNTRPKRIKDLLRHLPTFLFRFIRLLSFIFFLLPAFIVFVYHYLCCDRVAVYYGLNDINNERREDEGERQLFSRHYLDVYGSRMINGHYCNTTQQQQQQQQQQKKKPVLIFVTGGAWIIGYRMWGCLLARALTPFNILVIIPDYRNFPKVNIKGMVHDVDMAIQWTLDNIEQYGGDKDRVVLVGQSAGAHIGGVIVAKKVLDWIADQKRKRRQQSQSSQQQDGEEEEDEEEECRHLKSTYSPQQLCGFISTSSPHNLVTMRSVFHRHGLSAAVQKSIFGGDSSSSSNDDDDEMLNDKKLLSTDDNNTISNNDMDVFESWSPYHLVKKCETEFVSLVGINENSNNNDNNCNKERFDIQVQNIFPKLCIIHGTADKTVPVEEAIEFIALLTNLKVSVDSRMYQGWSHTDPILEKPMLGNHLYHRDIYELMCLWTKRSECCCDDVGGLQQHQLGSSVYNECMSTSYSSNEDSEHKSDSATVETCHNTGMTGKIMMEMGGEKNAAPTNNTTSLDDDLPPFDEMHPMLRPICPKSLVEIARVCNPF
ncbi:hypothetical protein ACHAWC_007339 [Mediolabrus comicus]